MSYAVKAASAFEWSVTHLKLIWIAVGCFALTLPVAWLIDPDVDAIPPVIAPVEGVSAGAMAPEGGAKGPDFVFRPLFLAGRKPLAPQEVAVEEAQADAADASDAEPETLDGVVLLGVIASGDRQAIIVRSEGERRSLMAGDQILGWTLSSVNARSAEFTNASGGLAKVDLAMASNLALPLARQVAAAEEPQQSPRAEGPVTFESMYERRQANAAAEDAQTAVDPGASE